MMTDDATLLREYAGRNSEEAFTALVSRHINLVYSVALRQVRDPHLAEEITQAVFIILARKAKSLGPKTILPGWLCRTARNVSANALTMQRRRQRREQEAYMQSTLNEPAADETWRQIAPLLDDALARLGQKDHDALVLRFFENKSLVEVGLAIGASEDTARMRVNRALEKLRTFFTKRGVSSTTAIIAETISANSVQVAPVALAKAVTAVALAKGAAASASTLTLIQGALKIMAWTKAKTAIVVGVGIFLAATASTVTVREVQAHRKYPWEVPEADFAVFYKMPATVKIVPTKFAQDGGRCSDGSRGALGIAQPLKEIIQVAYQRDSLHTVVMTDLPTNRYDFIAKLVGPQEPHKTTPQNRNWTVELQKEIANKFGFQGRIQMRETDVLALKPSSTGTQGFKISHTMPNGLAIKQSPGSYSFHEQPVGMLTGLLQQRFQIPIVNQIGLAEKYDFSLTWDEPDRTHPNLDGLKQALRDQLGLELVPTNMPVEMLVVEKTK
ncbi:MAG TPA: TIGR03435 family protein [Verrucomicrobiae bacterium]